MTETAITDVNVRPAAPADLQAVESLLKQSDLPLDGVKEALSTFVVADRDGRIVGVAGLERCGDYGLLRSAAVDQAWRGQGLGRTLVDRVISAAESAGIRALYLLTTTAEDYFPAFGFQKTKRETVPAELQRTAEFMGACPSSATVMTLPLGAGPGSAKGR